MPAPKSPGSWRTSQVSENGAIFVSRNEAPTTQASYRFIHSFPPRLQQHHDDEGRLSMRGQARGREVQIRRVMDMRSRIVLRCKYSPAWVIDYRCEGSKIVGAIRYVLNPSFRKSSPPKKTNCSAKRCIWRYRVQAGVWNCQILNQVVELVLRFFVK